MNEEEEFEFRARAEAEEQEAAAAGGSDRAAKRARAEGIRAIEQPKADALTNPGIKQILKSGAYGAMRGASGMVGLEPGSIPAAMAVGAEPRKDTPSMKEVLMALLNTGMTGMESASKTGSTGGPALLAGGLSALREGMGQANRLQNPEVYDKTHARANKQWEDVEAVSPAASTAGVLLPTVLGMVGGRGPAGKVLGEAPKAPLSLMEQMGEMKQPTAPAGPTMASKLANVPGVGKLAKPVAMYQKLSSLMEPEAPVNPASKWQTPSSAFGEMSKMLEAQGQTAGPTPQQMVGRQLGPEGVTPVGPQPRAPMDVNITRSTSAPTPQSAMQGSKPLPANEPAPLPRGTPDEAAALAEQFPGQHQAMPWLGSMENLPEPPPSFPKPALGEGGGALAESFPNKFEAMPWLEDMERGQSMMPEADAPPQILGRPRYEEVASKLEEQQPQSFRTDAGEPPMKAPFDEDPMAGDPSTTFTPEGGATPPASGGRTYYAIENLIGKGNIDKITSVKGLRDAVAEAAQAKGIPTPRMDFDQAFVELRAKAVANRKIRDATHEAGAQDALRKHRAQGGGASAWDQLQSMMEE